MLEGLMTCWRFRLQYRKGWGTTSKDKDGECTYHTHKMQADIDLNPNLGAVAHVDTVIHELAHLLKIVYHLDISHRDIYNIASGFTEALITVGLVDPLKWEAHIRMNANTVEVDETK